MITRLPIFRVCGFIIAVCLTWGTFALATQIPKDAQATPAPGYTGTIHVNAPEKNAPQSPKTQPTVVFPHEKHTAALDSQGMDCASCHTVKTDSNGRKHMSFDFKNTKKVPASDSKNAYHDGCVSCHTEQSKKSKQSGPNAAECRSCHTGAKADSKKTDGGFDAALHTRHIQSPAIKAPVDPKNPQQKDNCAACHHPVPTKTSPQLKADSCRSCHSPKMNRSSIPFGKAAHEVCISCHINSIPQRPVTCSSCHDAAVKAKQPKLSPKPRLDAGQPDEILMLPQPRTDAEKAKGTPVGMAKPVVFPHKVHEMKVSSCQSCHHRGFAACSTCHTPTGSPKGGNVPLAQAMHSPTSSRSCIGCHEKIKTKQPECAGCHTTKPRAAKNTCAACHVTPVGISDAAAQDGSLFAKTMKERAELAKDTISARQADKKTFDLSAAPELVIIDSISKDYKPVVMQHRDIINAMIKGMQKQAPGMTQLHTQNYTICQSCHHNSPASATPPPCSSCHAKEARPGAKKAVNSIPLLKVAYHQQCMSCHDRMNVKKPANTDCAACHVKRTPAQ